jgi:hypothetical protein
MATYIYETIPPNAETAPVRFEIQQSMHEPALTHDPDSQLQVKRVLVGGFAPMGIKHGEAPSDCSHGGSGQCCG